MKILNLENENRKFTKSIENFHVMEYLQDSSVSPMTAMEEYYMSKMNVRRRQVVIELDKEHSAIIQSGAMHRRPPESKGSATCSERPSKAP